MEREEAIAEIAALLGRIRWGALASTSDDGSALASQVAAAVDIDAGRLLFHLSELAEHTRNILARPGASVVLGEPDTNLGDPQTLARVMVAGTMTRLDRGSVEAVHAKAAYVTRFPSAEPRFDFGDFALYALEPARAQYVGGFARARALDANDIKTSLKRVRG